MKDIAVAMVVGAYAGWVGIRYLSFKRQLQAARQIAGQCTGIVERMLRHNDMVAAEGECSQLLMESAANLQGLGFRTAAHAMTSSSQGAQLGLFGLWQRIKACEARGDSAGRETELRTVREFQNNLISDINKTPLGLVALLFGARMGGLAEGMRRRWNRFQAYRRGERDDWK